jgi:hypothetical protein
VSGELIREVIVTSLAEDGGVHVAPFGIRQHDDLTLIAPFRPSTTLDNLLRSQTAVVNMSDDVRVFAGALTGRRTWSVRKADKINGWVLESALAHREMELVEVVENDLRPELWLRAVHEASHAPFQGFNRAQAAVIELAVLVSRLHMLPAEKIDEEIRYLTIAISKTAGERELEAWGWLMEKIENFRAQQTGGNIA